MLIWRRAGGNSLLIGLVCGAVLLLLLLLAFIIGTRIVIVRNRAGIRSPARPEAEIPLPEVSTSTDGDTMRDRQLNAIQRDVNDLGNDIQDMFQSWFEARTRLFTNDVFCSVFLKKYLRYWKILHQIKYAQN